MLRSKVEGKDRSIGDDGLGIFLGMFKDFRLGNPRGGRPINP
jgi:hypothetical protein